MDKEAMEIHIFAAGLSYFVLGHAERGPEPMGPVSHLFTLTQAFVQMVADMNWKRRRPPRLWIIWLKISIYRRNARHHFGVLMHTSRPHRRVLSTRMRLQAQKNALPVFLCCPPWGSNACPCAAHQQGLFSRLAARAPPNQVFPATHWVRRGIGCLPAISVSSLISCPPPFFVL